MAAPTSRLPEHLVYPGQNQEIFSTRRKSLKVITAVRMRIIHTNRGNPCAWWNIHPSKKDVEFQNVVSFFLWTFVKPKYFVKEVCHFSIILLEQNIVLGLNKMPLNFTTKLTPGRLHIFNFFITWVTQVTFWHWSSSVVRRLSSYNYNKIVKFMYPALGVQALEWGTVWPCSKMYEISENLPYSHIYLLKAKYMVRMSMNSSTDIANFMTDKKPWMHGYDVDELLYR